MVITLLQFRKVLGPYPGFPDKHVLMLYHRINYMYIPQVRKKGKLPGECKGIEYALEYGSAAVEVQKEAFEEKQRVLIVDDLLATGGTLKAAVDLVQAAGSEIVECFVIMELAFIKAPLGRAKIPKEIKVSSLISYD